jgi:hypothetical protein
VGGHESVSETASIRVRNPVIRKGKKILVTTAKEGPEGATIRRTTSGELADLQIKMVSGQIVHLHCLKDAEASAFNRGGSRDLKELYDIFPVLRIRCRTCGREWFNDGFNCESHASPRPRKKGTQS